MLQTFLQVPSGSGWFWDILWSHSPIGNELFKLFNEKPLLYRSCFQGICYQFGCSVGPKLPLLAVPFWSCFYKIPDISLGFWTFQRVTLTIFRILIFKVFFEFCLEYIDLNSLVHRDDAQALDALFMGCLTCREWVFPCYKKFTSLKNIISRYKKLF